MKMKRSAMLVLLAGLLTTSVWAEKDDQQVPGSYSVPVTVTSKGVNYPGTFTIKKFDVINNQLNAIGTLTTALPGTSGMTNAVTSIAVPVTTNVPSASTAAAAAPTSCPILHLVLGPLNLNLLGLQVTLNQVVLDINAIPGPGNLLGNLLCDIANLLNGGGALHALVNTLNQLLASL